MSDIPAVRPAYASAPLRLDFAGGWTDVPPFSAREGGAVVNASIGLYVHVSVVPGGEGIVLRSEDLAEELTIPALDPMRTDGRLPLLRAAVRLYPVDRCTVTSRSEAPAGSGLGSSGALDVALVSALSQFRGQTISGLEIAEAAWRLEVVEAGMPGGKQDQWISALGGFQSLTFCDPVVASERLTMEPEFLQFLERHVVLCYTGTSRISGRMISRVVQGYERGETVIVSAFHGMKEVALGMREALVEANPVRVGDLLNQNWIHQCALDPGMRTDEMARLEQAVASVGVLGGKAAGAGAGGCMFFLARTNPEAVARAARAAGARVLPVAWTLEGVRTW
jgi:D-glycero-alpha-D-manno-heptose-7-phosphate kinase